jgi:catechol 2,3-dioxygenase-like lactoylglutathione lyase family enzyme
MISHVHSATVGVKDQDAALDFYINVLGFEKVIDQPMGPEMRFITVRPEGAVTELSLAHESWAGEFVKVGGPTGISFITRDIDATHQTFSERGVRFKGEVEMMPWGQRAVWFYDQDGNEFFLNEEK